MDPPSTPPLALRVPQNAEAGSVVPDWTRTAAAVTEAMRAAIFDRPVRQAILRTCRARGSHRVSLSVDCGTALSPGWRSRLNTLLREYPFLRFPLAAIWLSEGQEPAHCFLTAFGLVTSVALLTMAGPSTTCRRKRM